MDKEKRIIEIRNAIFDYLNGKDSPMENVVEHILYDKKLTENVSLIGEVIEGMLNFGTIEISGVYPHGTHKKSLDIRIRRSSDFKSVLGSAC